jgi:hypothetical protein
MVRKVSDVARKRMSYTTSGVFIIEQPLEPARCNLSEFGTGQGHGLAVGVRAMAWSFVFTSPGWACALGGSNPSAMKSLPVESIATDEKSTSRASSLRQ